MWPFAKLPDSSHFPQRQIGIEILIRNTELGINWRGPASFVIRSSRQAGINLDHVANLLMTEISITPVAVAVTITSRQVAEGTPRSERKELMAGVDDDNLRAVRRLLKRRPTLARLLPLDWCAWNGLSDAVAELLRADKDAVDRPLMAGMTMLHWAAANGQTSVVKKLVTAGANTGLRNDFLWTAEQIARVNKHMVVAKLVVDGSQRGERPVSEVFELMGIRPRA